MQRQFLKRIIKLPIQRAAQQKPGMPKLCVETAIVANRTKLSSHERQLLS